MTAYDIAVITRTPETDAYDPDVVRIPDTDVITSWWRRALVRITGNKKWYWKWTSGPTVIADEVPAGNLAHGSDVYLDTSDPDEIDWRNLPDDWQGQPATRVLIVHGASVLSPVFELGEILFLRSDTGREITGLGRKPDKWLIEYEIVDTLDEAIALSRKVCGYDT